MTPIDEYNTMADRLERALQDKAPGIRWKVLRALLDAETLQQAMERTSYLSKWEVRGGIKPEGKQEYRVVLWVMKPNLDRWWSKSIGLLAEMAAHEIGRGLAQIKEDA